MPKKQINNQMLINLGKQCRELRQHKGISLDKMVKLSGFSQPTISDFENGKRNVTILFIQDYMNALKIDYEILNVKSKGRKGKELKSGRRPGKPLILESAAKAYMQGRGFAERTIPNPNPDGDWW